MSSPQPGCSSARSPPSSQTQMQGELLYRCTVCHYKTKTQYNLTRHIRVHIEPDSFPCRLCKDVEFGTERELKSHSYSLHMGYKKDYNCRICKARYTQWDNLQKHINKEHKGKRNFRCTICKQGFVFAEDLKRHVTIHFKEGSVQCIICNLSFANIALVKNHMKNTHKTFNCCVCKKSFWDMQTVEDHMETEHTNKRLNFTCKICNKEFEFKKTLQQHKKRHYKFECNICKRKLANPRHLKRHKIMHESTRPFTCDICRKGFIDERSLIKHTEAKHA